ncbi:hypothetical protein HOLleu_07193 [Holothuria leucospilota]|uniref:RING-type domain-containing protein n=1 Tax=Holothuria leucospilota TaxID=206669 RepID=A0A9Q1CGD2_HOLLE|nr:hypothetical protein HOLleu_07193 [Holothuria leucospilota]
MVTGICQHRFCTACVYTENGKRRAGLAKCPTCQLENALPPKRPIIPEDVIEMQKTLGITRCPNENCPEDMWIWEVENHLKECHTDPPEKKSTLDNRCKKNLSTPKRANSPVESKSGKPRIGTHEVGELLDGARIMMQQRRRSRSRGCLPDTFHMRYPLRNVNR